MSDKGNEYVMEFREGNTVVHQRVKLIPVDEYEKYLSSPKNHADREKYLREENETQSIFPLRHKFYYFFNAPEKQAK